MRCPICSRDRRRTLGLLLAMTLGGVGGFVGGRGGAVRAQEESGRFTGLPLPRFVSLAADEVNMRVGPRRTYDVIVVYRREGLPVKIVDEFDNWRQIVDHEGDSGWIHSQLLSSRRTVMVTGEQRPMYRTPDAQDLVLLHAEPEVIGELVDCEGAWCLIEIDGRRGWMRAEWLWGSRL